eukprot:8511301-Heterocapsa_arctica.AAC.1
MREGGAMSSCSEASEPRMLHIKGPRAGRLVVDIGAQQGSLSNKLGWATRGSQKHAFHALSRSGSGRALSRAV